MSGAEDEESSRAQALGLDRVGEADERLDVARLVGNSVREVIERLTATGAPAGVLREVARRTAEIVDLLAGYESGRSYQGVAEASGAGRHPGTARDPAFFDWSPVFGLANPLAPPIHVSLEGETVIGRCRFGPAYEGPPGCVHGGFVAAAFDEVLGLTQSLAGQVGMTGTLTVRYRRPTPLNSDLRFEGRVESVQGRKVVTVGEVFDPAGQVTAEATGLFITITPERFSAFAAHRDPHPE